MARWRRWRLDRRKEPAADRFSRRAANATAILALTSVGTLWLLILQLSEMHLDQRAWLGVDKINTFDFKAGPGFTATFDMSNTGKTPALKVKTRTTFKSLEKGKVFTATYDTTPNDVSTGVVQPQMHLTLSTLPTDVSPAQYGDIQNGRGMVYAYGDITYEDVFHKPHETTFCLMYYVGLSAPAPCTGYNEAN